MLESDLLQSLLALKGIYLGMFLYLRPRVLVGCRVYTLTLTLKKIQFLDQNNENATKKVVAVYTICIYMYCRFNKDCNGM